MLLYREGPVVANYGGGRARPIASCPGDRAEGAATSVSWVLDVYGPDRQRAVRFSGEQKATGPTWAWAQGDDETLRRVVERARDLMRFNVERGILITDSDGPPHKGTRMWIQGRRGLPCRRCRVPPPLSASLEREVPPPPTRAAPAARLPAAAAVVG